MSAYLKFHQLERSPFDGSAQSQVVLGTKALRDAFATIESGLEEGAARICVSGGAGMGKTSLARALPRLLGEGPRVAVVRDPSVAWNSLRETIARQWGLSEGGLPRAKLLEVARKQRLVLVIDQAEKASADFLDHLDVMLCYRSDDESPVVQSVLLANLSTGNQGEPNPLIWWLDRIHTLQLEFAPLPRDGVGPYIEKHLKRAGWQGESLFTADAAHVIHEFTGGIPGEVGKLCERLLSAAARSDLHEIDAGFVRQTCDAREARQGLVEQDQSEEWVVDIDGEDAVAESRIAHGGMSADEDAFDPASAEMTQPLGRHDGYDVADEGHATDASDEGLEAAAAGEDAPDDWDEDEDFAATGADTPFGTETDAATGAEAGSMLSLEQFLSQPASREELRKLFGGGFARYARTVVAIAAAIAVVGIGIGLLMGGEPEADEPSLVGLQSKTSPPAPKPGNEGGAPVIARMRGPVLPGQSADSMPTTANEAETETRLGTAAETKPEMPVEWPDATRPAPAPDMSEPIGPAAPAAPHPAQ